MKYLVLFISLLVGAWVFYDARLRGKGIVVAVLWCLGTQVLPIFFLPLWLIVRPERCLKVVIVQKTSRCTDCGE